MVFFSVLFRSVDVKGEILELKNTINTMVDQLNAFASEVTRVAREVGTEGRLGGQAAVSGVAGTWKDLTDSVNVMAANLTDQVRGIVKVVTAVADGLAAARDGHLGGPRPERPGQAISRERRPAAPERARMRAGATAQPLRTWTQPLSLQGRAPEELPKLLIVTDAVLAKMGLAHPTGVAGRQADLGFEFEG